MPIFTTETELDYNEIKRYNGAVIFRNKKTYLRLLWIILIVAILFQLLFKNLIFPIVFLVFMPIAVYIGFLGGAKKNYKRISDLGITKQKTNFYKSYLESVTSKNKRKIKYVNVADIIENKSNFYVMTSDNYGVIIEKDNCEPDLIEFLTNLKNKTVTSLNVKKD